MANTFCWSAVMATVWSLSSLAVQDGARTAEPCRVAASLSRLPGLTEASGVALSRRSPGILWMVIDSGPPVIYALDANRGAVIGKVTVTGARVDDWEDVSVGACPRGTCLYVADIGDNKAVRDHVTIYRVAEPEPKAPATEQVEVLQASYPDGPQDAEALFVNDQGQIYIITKGETGPIALYRFPENSPAAGGRLERVRTLAIATGVKGPKVTDAESSPDGKWVAVRTHDAVVFYRPADLASASGREAFHADVRSLREPQGEGVAIGSAGEVYLIGESGGVGTFARLSCTFPN